MTSAIYILGCILAIVGGFCLAIVIVALLGILALWYSQALYDAVKERIWQ